MSCTMESTESSETLFQQNAGTTIDSNNSEPEENSNVTSPMKNLISNRERKVEVNTVGNDISNVGRRKYRKFLDSDSEEEDHLKKHDSDATPDNEINVSEKVGYSENARRFVDDDSDKTKSKGDERRKSKSADQSATDEPLKWKFQTIIDSDSADEDSPDPTSVENPKKVISQSKIRTKSGLCDILDSESEYEGHSDSASPTVKTTKKKNGKKKMSKTNERSSLKISISENVIDTDSDEEASQRDNVASANKSEKKTNGLTASARWAKDEAMRQIHSETQRLVRTSAISLPYHVPKQRTLQDFLNRRKLIPCLPEGISTAFKVKMFSEIVSKALQEKEREAETFYKSSDSEEEEITCTPLNTNPFDEDLCSVDQTGIQETRKILKNDLQNAHNKKEIIQQGGAEIGVPRKLFGVDEALERQMSLEGKEEREQEEEAENEGDEDPLKSDRRNKKTKEMKQGMREGNVPRKLFPSDYDECLDSSPKDAETVSAVDAKSSEKHAPLEIDGVSEAVDEGIHSLEKNNQSSESCEDNDNHVKLRDSEFTETSSVYKRKCINSNPLDISETPFISNREWAKLNERGKLSKTRHVLGDVVGLPPSSFDEPSSSCPKTIATRKSYVRALPKIQPKLRGTPGMMIDLTSNSKPDRDGVQLLRDRFFKHSVINKSKEMQTSVSVMRTEKTSDGLKVVEEFLPYKIPVGGFTEGELQKPGAKYKRLKMDLIEKMAKKRGEEWELEAQRDKEAGEQEEEEEYDVDEEGMTESEPEVNNDMPVGKKKKKRKLRQFADEEAEVSLDETEEEEEDDDDDDDISLRVEKDEDSLDDCSEREDGGNTCRKSRIVNAFEEDSNSEADIVGGGKALERTTTDVDMFAPEKNDWSSDNESEFPLSQILPRDQADARSQLCKTPLTAINALRFVSPITQLTALNTSCHTPKESPADRFLQSCPISASFIDKTPNGIDKESPVSCENDKRLNFQKKLFQESSTAINDDELMGLCSGKFTGIENEAKNPIDPMAIGSPAGCPVTETQLLGLCSGMFASQIYSFDEDKDEKSKCTARRVVSSSEDSEDEKGVKKKVGKLELSDDEESGKAEEKYVDYDSEENEIVLVAKKDMKKVAATFLEAEAELSESEWGSEDEDEKDMDRLEFEEGDDEEIDQDQMRDQLGKIHMRRVQDDDQRQVRMLQELLFDDGDLHTDGSGRERIFKWKKIDTLGDDDKFGTRDDANGEENGNIVDNENDLAWLNEKMERDKFLEDKTKTNADADEVFEDMARDSQVFSLGVKALKNMKSNQQQNSQKEQLEPTVTTKPLASRIIFDLLDTKCLATSTTIVRKAVSRGSFLARGDESLARMAVHFKENNATVIKRANPRNFVFGQMNPMDEEYTRINEAAGDISLQAIKGNKRKSSGGLLTPRSTKKVRLEKNRPTAKKLY